MRVKKLLACLVLITACGTGSGGSTTAPDPGTSLPSTTSTTEASTTSADSTTTTEATTSTTGAAGERPAVVASRFGLMGWWSDGWVVPEGLEDIPLTGGEEFQVVMLDQTVTTTIGSAPTLCEPSLTPVIDFDPPLPGDFQDPGALAVIAGWELRPSPVRVESDLAEVHLQAVIDVLVSLGIDADPIIFQQVVADLDGDSAEEIVIVAKQLPDDLFAQPGDYSIVVLRKMIEGEWQTAILETSLAEPDSAYILSYSIPAIADLNGDGRMEIVVDAAYYEGAGTVAYEYVNDDLGAEPVLRGGCGA